jgi:hypothetical protein
MKLVKIVLVLALAFAFTGIAYAETQSVKVSGDITMRAFMRDNFDLNSRDANTAGGASTNMQSFLQSTAEVQIDADLTDNVSGVIRLLNQRAWGDNYYQFGSDPEITNRDRSDNNAFNVAIDLAYIELKEFLYSPLTLKIGRQDIWFGKGFIIGNSLMDPQGNLAAPEYTAINSFDAIRATLDYDPWTIDVVYAKIAERDIRADDDVNLMGINVGYIFDEYNAEAEAYYWMQQDRNPGTSRAGSFSSRAGRISNDIHTMGMRGSFDPIEDWTVALEGAMQFGNYLGVNNQVSERDRFAYAIDAMVETRIFQEDYAWRPVLAAEYIVYSGQNNFGDQVNDVQANGNYTGWNSMYRGKFDTAIREFQGSFYGTTQPVTPATTNQHQMLFKATVEPMDSVKVEGVYAFFWLYSDYANEATANSQENTNRFIGQEIDVNVTWDYTEDVQFGLLTGWFFPGSAFSADVQGIGKKAPATNMVGTVKLSF